MMNTRVFRCLLLNYFVQRMYTGVPHTLPILGNTRLLCYIVSPCVWTFSKCQYIIFIVFDEFTLSMGGQPLLVIFSKFLCIFPAPTNHLSSCHGPFVFFLGWFCCFKYRVLKFSFFFGHFITTLSWFIHCCDQFGGINNTRFGRLRMTRQHNRIVPIKKRKDISYAWKQLNHGKGIFFAN